MDKAKLENFVHIKNLLAIEIRQKPLKTLKVLELIHFNFFEFVKNCRNIL